jgi:polar amino acid transport system substrate-binding protein
MMKFASLLGALALSFAFLAPSASAQESQLDVVLKRDKLIVGTYSTSPPLAYVDDSGNLVGFEIDMAHQIAKDLLGDPNKVEFVVLQSDGRFPAALSGKIDFGLCSTTITGDRAVRIAFTRPYLDTGGSIIARRDAGIKTIQELNNAKSIADYYEAENKDLVRLDTTGTPFAYVSQDSIFMKPGDFKWWLFLDTWVGELRYGSRYEFYVAWYQKWMKKDAPPQRAYDFNKY